MILMPEMLDDPVQNGPFTNKLEKGIAAFIKVFFYSLLFIYLFPLLRNSGYTIHIRAYIQMFLGHHL